MDISVRRLSFGAAGTAAFGFALCTAVMQQGISTAHLRWSVSWPTMLLLAWALCLPAFYILWASRSSSLHLSQCCSAAAEAVAITGAALASTAPILWFFAATAPSSPLLAPMGLLFSGLAFFAGGSVFQQKLAGLGASVPRHVSWGFQLLVLLTTIQFLKGTQSW